MTARVGVFIPAYNGVKYIAASIESVLEQSFPDHELWVVDDCSTDCTRSVVERFRDSRIHLVSNTQNLGLVGNWNRCIELADSELVLILHQDDCLSRNMLSDVVRFFDTCPALGLISTGAQPIDANGKVGWPVRVLTKRYREQGDSRILAAGTDSVLHLLKYGVAISGVVVPRAVYQSLGKLDPNMPYSADEEMWVRIGAHYPIGLLPKTIVYQRNHSHQFRNETWKRHDFLDQYLAVQRRRFAYLSADEQQAHGGDEFPRRLAARAGSVIALRSLALGEPNRAQYYLATSEQISPRIAKEPLHRVARLLCRMPRLGQLICKTSLGLE